MIDNCLILVGIVFSRHHGVTAAVVDDGDSDSDGNISRLSRRWESWEMQGDIGSGALHGHEFEVAAEVSRMQLGEW